MFEKSDSFAILESSRRNGRVLVMLESDGDDGDDAPRRRKVSAAAAAPPPPPPHLTLHVKLRLARLLLLTAAVSLSALALVAACRHGIELTRFPAASMTESERSKLLDDYNSYSGTLAAMVGRPLEIFVALLAQIMLVRCAAGTMVRDAEPGRRVWLATLVLSAGVGYLLNNVLNALNVQLRSLEVRPLITANDLSVVGTVDALDVGSVIANNRTNTVSELRPKNPISNTVLRNLVLPREAKSPPNCPWPSNADVVMTVVPDDLLDYGLPQRDWQSLLLSEAIEPQRLRLVVNATNASANAGVRNEDLPMPVNQAANLFMNGLLLMNSFLPIDSYASYFNRKYPNVTIPGNESSPMGAAAIMAGALPPPPLSADDNTQRAWFLNQSQALFLRHVNQHDVHRSDLGLEFSHVQITPSIVFDAVTFDLEMDPALLGQLSASTNNRTRETTIDRAYCGPWPALCQLSKLKFSSNNDRYDPQMQVQAFSVCVDAAGDETLLMKATYMDGDLYPPTSVFSQCSHTSNSSLLVVSVAKRLTADSLVLHQPWSRGQNATATNLRKFYSYTVGRLAWEVGNLSTVFNASCGTPSLQYLGLHVALSDSAPTPAQSTRATQQLVVGADALPLAFLSEPNYAYAYSRGNGKQRSLPLVRIHEPPPSRANDAREYDALAGDILFPHNIRDVQWQQPAVYNGCNAVIEDRLQLVLKNHMYMEHSLQAAYTAATFFLLQNGVVKDVITLAAHKTSLQFQGNQQDIAVRVSVPALNAWLTLAGCALVVVCALVAVAWPAVLERQSKPDALQAITTPHAIARVLLDEKRFPPLLLERRIVDSSGVEGNDHADIEQLRVESIALAPPTSRRRTSMESQV